MSKKFVDLEYMRLKTGLKAGAIVPPRPLYGILYGVVLYGVLT
jgi:hypothetical protein